ncbi:hypothetical protein EV127DRAFT_243180 [Xylaria flabelliformis]|nr:hypothetical protein EV127DRAFT_243180 [Xylaria flabelliformis]
MKPTKHSERDLRFLLTLSFFLMGTTIIFEGTKDTSRGTATGASIQGPAAAHIHLFERVILRINYICHLQTSSKTPAATSCDRAVSVRDKTLALPIIGWAGRITRGIAEFRSLLSGLSLLVLLILYQCRVTWPAVKFNPRIPVERSSGPFVSVIPVVRVS